MAMEALAEGLCGSFVQRNRNHHGLLDFPSLSDPPEDATLRLINQMLMEEDGLEDKPCMFQESLALQATEKSFYDAIGQKYPPSATTASAATDRGALIPPDNTSSSTSTESSFYFYVIPLRETDLKAVYLWTLFLLVHFRFPIHAMGANQCCGYSMEETQKKFHSFFQEQVMPMFPVRKLQEELLWQIITEIQKQRTHDREGGDCVDGSRRNKKLANSAVEYPSDISETLDKLLLCPRLSPHLNQEPSSVFMIIMMKQSEAGGERA